MIILIRKYIVVVNWVQNFAFIVFMRDFCLNQIFERYRLEVIYTEALTRYNLFSDPIVDSLPLKYLIEGLLIESDIEL